MEKVIIRGKISRLTIKRDTDQYAVTRYSPNTERYVVYANICVKGDDGVTYYFNSPSVKMRVANCPVASIVTYDIGKRSGSKWWTEKEGKKVATSESPNENELIFNLKEGDEVYLKGFVKVRKDNYTSLTRMSFI